jgi:hypothetical protein
VRWSHDLWARWIIDEVDEVEVNEVPELDSAAMSIAIDVAGFIRGDIGPQMLHAPKA